MTPPTGGPRRGSNRHQPQVDNPTGAPGVEATTRTATRTAALSRLEVSPPPPVLIDIAMREPAEQQPLTALNAAAQQPLTAVNAVPHLPPQVNFIAQALPAARTEPTEPPNTVSSVVLAALATVGLGPLAANGPVLPADSPVGWALLAVGARRFGQPAIQETRNLPAIPTMTSQSIDGAATSTAIASPAATVNSVSVYLSSTHLENQASIAVGTKPSGRVGKSRWPTAICRQHRQQHRFGDQHCHWPKDRRQPEQYLLDRHLGGLLARRAGTEPRRQTAVCGQHRQRHGVGDQHRHLPTHRRQPEHLLD